MLSFKEMKRMEEKTRRKCLSDALAQLQRFLPYTKKRRTQAEIITCAIWQWQNTYAGLFYFLYNQITTKLCVVLQ